MTWLYKQALILIVGLLLMPVTVYSGTETYTYDDAGRLTGAVYGSTSVIYSYDASGNLLSRTVGGGVLSGVDGVWKDGAPPDGMVTMNFYVQTYSTGSVLVVASPDGVNAYAFLDDDLSNGVDTQDLGGLGHHLVLAFATEAQGSATLTLSGGSPRAYALKRWFAASASDNYQGIFKDAPSGSSGSMSFYVQTYDESIIMIESPDARTFHVFLDGSKSDGVDADSLGGGAHLTCSFSGPTQGAGSITSGGTPQNFTLYRWFEAPYVEAPAAR